MVKISLPGRSAAKFKVLLGRWDNRGVPSEGSALRFVHSQDVREIRDPNYGPNTFNQEWLRQTKPKKVRFANFWGRSPELVPEPPFACRYYIKPLKEGVPELIPDSFPESREPHFLWFGLPQALLMHNNQEWPRQTKPKKGQFMNFSRGHSRTKFNVNRACFPKEKHQNS